MIWFKGSDNNKNILIKKGLELSRSFSDNIDVVILEFPFNASILKELSKSKVFVISEKMLSLADINLLSKYNIEHGDINEIVEKVKDYLDKLEDSKEELRITKYKSEEQPSKKLSEKKKDITPPQKKDIGTNYKRIPEKKEELRAKRELIDRESIDDSITEKILLKKEYKWNSKKEATFIVVFSSKGGVGKTFISSSSACYLSLQGNDTCLVDMDFNSSNADIATGLADPMNRKHIIDKRAVVPKNGWVTVLDWRRYAPNLKHNMLRHNSGLYVVPSYDFKEDKYTESEIDELLNILAHNFAYIVIDMGVDGFSKYARLAFSYADYVLIVSGQDNSSLGKINHFLKRYEYMDKSKLVVNMVDALGTYSPNELASKLGFVDFYEVPMDKTGVSSAAKNNMMVTQLKNSTSGEAVKDLINNLLRLSVDDTYVLNTRDSVTKKKNSSEEKTSLISRLIRFFIEHF